MLEYLDAPTNRKGHPNENLARALVELFTLGVGNYTEADVKEAARGLTGWSVDAGVFTEHAARHDDGPKTVLGATGNWTGTDLLNQLLKHPATADHVASKLVKAFFGEGACPADAVKERARAARARPGCELGVRCRAVPCGSSSPTRTSARTSPHRPSSSRV